MLPLSQHLRRMPLSSCLEIEYIWLSINYDLVKGGAP